MLESLSILDFPGSQAIDWSLDLKLHLLHSNIVVNILFGGEILHQLVVNVIACGWGRGLIDNMTSSGFLIKCFG